MVDKVPSTDEKVADELMADILVSGGVPGETQEEPPEPLESDLSYADFRGATLVETELTGMQLVGTDFRYVRPSTILAPKFFNFVRIT